jgi:PAS domain-containing protein
VELSAWPFSLTLVARTDCWSFFAGITSLAASFGVLITFATGWVATVIRTISEPALNAVFDAVVAQFAMSLTQALLTWHLCRENEQMHTAFDSMAQALCIFDASERLVVSNSRYYTMYNLTPAAP